MNIVAYTLFFLGGLAFGYAAPGKLKWLPLGFPVLLWLVSLVTQGFASRGLILLIIALAVVALGVLLGMVLDSREERGTAAESS